MDAKPVIKALPTRRPRDAALPRRVPRTRARHAAHPPARGALRASSTATAKIRGFLHLYIGEEAVAAGVMPHLRPEDNVVATYREHGHALLRGVSMNAIMAEMYGKREGCSRGRGGSMHLFDARHALLRRQRDRRRRPAAGVSGWRSPTSCATRPTRHGLLLRRGRGGRGRVPRVAEPRRAVAAAGAVHLREQPVRDGHGARALGIADRPRGEGRRLPASPTAHCNGMDVLAVARRGRAAATDHVRRTRTPYFLELHTYRFRAHSMFDAELYRDEGRGRGVEGARADPHVHAAAEGRRAC